jgi:hypothetical protein
MTARGWGAFKQTGEVGSRRAAALDDRQAHPLVVTGAAELEMQLAHPSAEVIRARATEVFGNAEKADTWLHRPPGFRG